jgi:HSP20 family protein
MRRCAVRPKVHAFAIQTDADDFADEIREVFTSLGRSFSLESLAGECSPPIDVYETDDTMEVVADLPGVTAASLHIIAKGDGLLVAGEKAPRRTRESSFHLVERGYGRFARVVRLGRPCNTSSARATLTGGELRISIPKVDDRRTRRIPISIT